MITKTFYHKGSAYLTLPIDDSDTFKVLEKFVGDYNYSHTPNGQHLIKTLEGWREVDVGDHVVHLFATEKDPLKITTYRLGVYNRPGFLVYNELTFMKYFKEDKNV